MASSSMAVAQPTVKAMLTIPHKAALGGPHVGAEHNMPDTLMTGVASAGQQQLPQRQQRSVEACTVSSKEAAEEQEETRSERSTPASRRARVAMRARNAMLSMRTRTPSAQGFMYAQIMPWIHT